MMKNDQKTNHVTHKKTSTHQDAAQQPAHTPPSSSRSLWTTIIILAVILLIMALIFFGVRYATREINKKKLAEHMLDYHNFTFAKADDNKWYTRIIIKGAPYDIPFYYNPVEAENVSVASGLDIGRTIWNFYLLQTPKQVFITLDPNTPGPQIVIAGVELSRLLGKQYNIYNFDTHVAITNQPFNQTLDYPLITCANASANTTVIHLVINTSAPQDRITAQGNCYTLEATTVNESIRVADAFSYRLLHIMG